MRGNKKQVFTFFVISKSVRSHLCHSTMHERRGAIKLLSCYFVPFPNFKLQSLHFTLYTRQTCQIPAFRYMRLLLTLSPSQMYEDETSGGLFLLLLSSRRLLCRQVGLAGFILHSQVSHFSSCFSFLDDPVCFSQSIHSGFFLHWNFCSLSGVGQCVGWSLPAGRGGGRSAVSHTQVRKSIAKIKWG